MKINQFVNIKIERDNLDTYVIRSAIFNAICSSLSNFKGDVLDIGCGKMPYKEYILNNSKVTSYTGLDIDEALNYDEHIKPDFTWDGVTMPFANESFDCAFGTEVLEHCFKPEIVLGEVYRVLKKGGVFFFTVPFLWNLHEVPNDAYRFTPFTLERYLKNIGYKNISIKATGGWHASMAQMLGLWVRRSSMSNKKRKILSSIFKPLIIYLLKIDKSNSVNFKDGQMITGLYGLAKK